jgi:hypothetical protein
MTSSMTNSATSIPPLSSKFTLKMLTLGMIELIQWPWNDSPRLDGDFERGFIKVRYNNLQNLGSSQAFRESPSNLMLSVSTSSFLYSSFWMAIMTVASTESAAGNPIAGAPWCPQLAFVEKERLVSCLVNCSLAKRIGVIIWQITVVL